MKETDDPGRSAALDGEKHAEETGETYSTNTLN